MGMSPDDGTVRDNTNPAIKLPKNAGFAADAEKMKGNAHEDLETKDYNVFDFYHETGFWQALAKSDRFGNLTLGVISFNAVWIGVDSDHNTKPPPHTDLQFILADQFFCFFFSFEWLTRFLAFANKRNCLKDGWFKFDSALVFLMVFETWITPLAMGDGGGGGMGDASMLRLLRLLRLTRMARLMRSVPELLVLLKGMAAAARSVSSTLALLMIFTYVFGIIFKQQTAGDAELEEMFGMIPEAMWNLLLGGTLLDNITDILNTLRVRNKMMCALFLFWVLLSSFTILNMLIGVLCEVVSAVSDAEKEKGIVSFAKEQFLTVLSRIDEDGNGTISEQEFENFVNDAEVKRGLEELEVDTDNLMSLQDVIFSSSNSSLTPQLPDQNANTAEIQSPTPQPRRSSQRWSQSSIAEVGKRELKFGELLEMILSLRASNPAMVSHIVDLRKHLRGNQKETMSSIQEIGGEVEGLEEHILLLDAKVDRSIETMVQIMARQDEKLDKIVARQNQILGLTTGTSPIIDPQERDLDQPWTRTKAHDYAEMRKEERWLPQVPEKKESLSPMAKFAPSSTRSATGMGGITRGIAPLQTNKQMEEHYMKWIMQ